MTVDTILVRDSEPVLATVDGKIVMLSIRAGAYFGLNGVGSEIWNMLTGPLRVGQICDSLSRLYDCDTGTIIEDVIPFLEALVNRRLLRVVDPGEDR